MKKGAIYARVHSHITFEQKRFLEVLSKLRNISEAEVLRDILEQEVDAVLSIPSYKKYTKEIRGPKK